METRKATRSGPHAANGLTIWRARKRAGVTQEDLATAIGISRIQQIKLENGMHLPKPATRDRMEERLGLEPGTIRCEEAVGPKSDPFRVGSRGGSAGAGGGASAQGEGLAA